MLDADDNVQRLLAAAVSDQPPGIDLLAGVRNRRAVRRTRTRALLAAAAVAVIAVAATVARTALQTPSASGTRTPLAAVTAAAARTMGQSYRFTATRESRAFPQPWVAYGSGVPSKETFDGIFDPVHRIGEVANSGTFNAVLPRGEEYQTDVTLYLGRTIYEGTGAGHGAGIIPPKTSPFYPQNWIKYEGGKSSTGAYTYPHTLFNLADPTAPPDRVLAVLKSEAKAPEIKVREIGPVSGTDWTGTRYAFTATRSFLMPPDTRIASEVSGLSGTVDVDQQGRVRVFEDTRTDSVIPKSGSATPFSQLTVTMVFSDFGVAVHVTAPPASEIDPPCRPICARASPAPSSSAG